MNNPIVFNSPDNPLLYAIDFVNMYLSIFEYGLDNYKRDSGMSDKEFKIFIKFLQLVSKTYLDGD